MSAIRWRDLIPLTRWERFVEVSLPLPWLGASLGAYALGWWALGAVGSFYVFLTGLRLSHNAQHACLGLRRWGHDAVLAVLSVVMGTSMHAVRASHLNHHRHALGEDDLEGRVASLPVGAVLRAGPRFMWDVHRFGLSQGPLRQRRWVALELLAIGALWPLAAAWGGPALLAHQVAMLTGELLTPFFAVWLVHRAAEHEPTRSRTERHPLVNLLTYDMLLHAEHHAHPPVPSIHWRQLATRRDAAASRTEPNVVAR